MGPWNRALENEGPESYNGGVGAVSTVECGLGRGKPPYQVVSARL
jgi:hypothetical protein